MALMTKADYAKRGIQQDDGSFRPVTKAYLSKAAMVARLAPAMMNDPKTGKLMIDPDKADEVLRETKDPSRSLSHMSGKAAGASKAAVGAFELVKTDLHRTKLENERLNLAERKGEILPRDDVTKAIMAAAQIIREHLKSSRRRLAEKFSTMSDAREISSVMEDEHQALLKQMSNDFLRRIPTLNAEGDAITAH